MARTLKQLTQHIRITLKRNGIPCNVRMMAGAVQVYTKGYDLYWTPDQLEGICDVARNNKLTMVMGTEIYDTETVRQLTGKQSFDFYPPRKV